MTTGGRLILRALEVLPEKRISQWARRAASVRSKAAIRVFASRYGVAVDEAEKDLEEYESLLDFFTRRLKPGLRPLDPDPRALLSPADGRLDAMGRIDRGRLVQAKGREYTLAALLADDQLAEHYRDGSFVTLYLSPRDYHRVHAPAGGVVTGATYVPGALFPVNPNAVAHVDSLFSRNERLITHLASEALGRIEVVMVGATCVGHIRVAYDSELKTNCGELELDRRSYQPPRPLERGGELGVFELGSTVVLILEAGVELSGEVGPIRVGMKIGSRG